MNRHSHGTCTIGQVLLLVLYKFHTVVLSITRTTRLNRFTNIQWVILIKFNIGIRSDLIYQNQYACLYNFSIFSTKNNKSFIMTIRISNYSLNIHWSMSTTEFSKTLITETNVSLGRTIPEPFCF